MQAVNPSADNKGQAIIVGGSLAGLMTALSIARAGLSVTLLERAGDSGRTGAALQIGNGVLARLTGRNDAPEFDGTRVQTWTAVHSYLRAAVERNPRIALHDGVFVTNVDQDGNRAWATAGDGQTFTGEMIIGADGHRSVVRRLVAPDRPNARFAGYVIWIGIAREGDLECTGDWPRETLYEEARDYVLLGSSLPTEEGFNQPGNRRIGWAWYDGGRNALLRERGALLGNVVQRSLMPRDIPDHTFDELRRDARLWSEPWRQAIEDCVERRAIIGAPIAEYLPVCLARGRVGLVGDAAHVPTPMTGSGFSAALEDAVVLGGALSGERSIEAALRTYEKARLPNVRRLVERGQDFSRSFISHWPAASFG